MIVIFDVLWSKEDVAKIKEELNIEIEEEFEKGRAFINIDRIESFNNSDGGYCVVRMFSGDWHRVLIDESELNEVIRAKAKM